MFPDYGSEDGEEFDDEEIESDDEDENQVDDDIQALLEQQKRKAVTQNGGNAKKAKVEQQKPKEVAPQQQKPKAETPNKPQQQQPKQQQQQKSPAQQTKAFPNGLEITTLQAGTGAEAVKGRMVSVKYVGRLTKNGKIFDASKKPFSFRLGAGEVIQGWDQGVAGMKVGEKRKLIIPSALGYGKQGAMPDIPGNASLTFDVELIRVN